MSPERSKAIDKIKDVSAIELLEGLQRNIRALDALERRTEENERHIAALERRLREVEREAGRKTQ